MSNTTTNVALKDWAVTVDELGAGELVFVVRKGGIREETKQFEVQSDEFFLYPAYEHQKEALLKPEYRSKLAETLKEWSPDQETMKIKYYARLVEDIEITNEEDLQKIYPYHIWVENFAVDRLKWKKKQPLHMLIMRVGKLETPVEVFIQPEYNSCKSWHQLPETLVGIKTSPVLSDQEFEQKVSVVKQALFPVNHL